MIGNVGLVKRVSEHACCAYLMDCWHFDGDWWHASDLVSTCGTICSKECVSLDLYAFFDHFRHQDIRSNGLEQSDSDIKGVGVAHMRICILWHQCTILLTLPLAPTRAGIKLKHLQCIHMTVNDSVLQGYIWSKSGGDGVMCWQCAIVVVVMCMVAALRKRRRLSAHFSVAVAQ